MYIHTYTHNNHDSYLYDSYTSYLYIHSSPPPTTGARQARYDMICYDMI